MKVRALKFPKKTPRVFTNFESYLLQYVLIMAFSNKKNCHISKIQLRKGLLKVKDPLYYISLVSSMVEHLLLDLGNPGSNPGRGIF